MAELKAQLDQERAQRSDFSLLARSSSHNGMRCGMSVEPNKKVVLSFLENFSAGRIDAALALMADDATWWIAGKPARSTDAGTKSKTEFADLIKEMLAEIPNGLRVTVKGLTAEGERVAVEAESYGETSSGKIYNNLYHFLFEIANGKIQAVREYFDTMHAEEVFGDQ